MKIGVIGTGIMGRNHIRVYSSLNDRCQLVGVYDTDFSRSSLVAEQYGTVAFHSLNDLLDQVDAVSIAVPISAHFDIGLTCLEKKVHILMEKPIAETIAQAKKLIEKADEAGVKLFIGHIELFNPTIHVLRNILSKEEILAVDIHRMSPLEPRIVDVDVVLDSMIHDIYIAFHLLGDSVDEVHALGRIYGDTVKHAIALMKFQNGIVAQLTASHVTEEKVRSIRVVARNAYIYADLLDKKIIISRSTNFFMNKANSSYRQQNIMEKVIVPLEEPLKLELTHFMDCIERNTRPYVSGDDGLIALVMANKISEMIR